jgi:hypothetical protein
MYRLSCRQVLYSRVRFLYFLPCGYIRVFNRNSESMHSLSGKYIRVRYRFNKLHIVPSRDPFCDGFYFLYHFYCHV